MKIDLNNINQLAWEKMSGLLPCTVQHALTGEVLMQAYMNTCLLYTSPSPRDA